MKKALALILCIVFTFSLCGCKDKEDKGKGGIDVEYYANLGQIPENDIPLGTSRDELLSALDKRGLEAEKNGEHYGYSEIEGDKNVLVEEGPYDYYYKKADPKKAVAYIVAYGDAFGFKTGDIIVEVEESLEKYDVVKEKANEKNAFFHFGDYEKAQILKITFKKNTVLFLFEDNALCATAIYSNDF